MNPNRIRIIMWGIVLRRPQGISQSLTLPQCTTRYFLKSTNKCFMYLYMCVWVVLEVEFDKNIWSLGPALAYSKCRSFKSQHMILILWRSISSPSMSVIKSAVELQVARSASRAFFVAGSHSVSSACWSQQMIGSQKPNLKKSINEFSVH